MNLTEYRDGDYDIDMYFDKTTSWPDGLQEVYRFMPYIPRAVRRTSSADDISRYIDHFLLAQKNQGALFTWRHYLKILKDDLRHFDTLVLMSKILLMRVTSPANSEISNYVTASESESSKNMTPHTKSKKRFIRKEIGADAESISSLDDLSLNSSISLTPHKNLLKKLCSEIRLLARKTCKTVEKMSTKPKRCSGCGDYIGSMKIHKKCSQPFVNMVEYKTPIITSKLTNLVRTQSESFDSPRRMPSGFGELTTASPQKMCSGYDESPADTPKIPIGSGESPADVPKKMASSSGESIADTHISKPIFGPHVACRMKSLDAGSGESSTDTSKKMHRSSQESLEDLHFSKPVFAPHAVCRVKSLGRRYAKETNI